MNLLETSSFMAASSSSNKLGLVNTQVFREAALYYDKFGRYDDGIVGSNHHIKWWAEQKKRCLEGYTSGGVYISGYYYHYLNFCRIQIVEETFKEVHKTKSKNARRVGERKENFPDFWDIDYMFFTAFDIAANGISNEEYEKLPIELNIKPEYRGGGRHLIWLKPRGVGAPQPVSEIVITPEGNKKIGDIKIGDYVFDRQGKPVAVAEIYPQGKLQVFEVTLMDGRVVTCGENHTWTVITRIRNGKPEYKDLTTKELIDSKLYYETRQGQKSYKYKIPKIEPVQFKEKEQVIPAYVLGALLGDGTINGKNIKISSDDIEIIDRFRELLPEFKINKDNSNNNYLISLIDEHDKFYKEHYNTISNKGRINPLKRELEILEANVICYNKFIPDIYKFGSIEQRLELIKGLMDTDGSISSQGYCEFVNSSKQLIDDLAYVLRSLGIYCSIGEDNRTGESHSITARNGEITNFNRGLIYRLYIATNINIFYLPRKANKINITKFTKANVAIVSIVALDKYEEQVCLGVNNSEHLYLTRDFIVTHNSWKGGSLGLRNFALIEKSKSYFLANEKEFLNKDGLYSKFLDLKDWQSVNALGLARSSDFKKDRNGMHFKSSVDLGGGVEGGYQAEVIGVSLQNNWQKARGKRGMLIEWEEAGKFPNMDLAWEVARPSVEEGDIVYGTMLAFGTGGTKDANFESLKKMFYDPLGYNILPFDNVYDIGKSGTQCGFFTPAYKNIAFKDIDGNSNEVLAKSFFDKERKDAEDSNDPTLLPRRKAENPYTPQEAILETGKNIWLTDGLVAHKNYVEQSKLHKTMATQGFFTSVDGKLKFKVDPNLIPIHIFPHKDKYTNYNGAVLIFEPPFKINERIPDNLYTCSVDTYRHDTSTGDSIGSVIIMENANNLTRSKGDRIVATYSARPESQEKFNEVMFELAEYFNAKIGFENDEPGDVVGYAKRHKKLHLLTEEFELAFDEKFGVSKTKRGFGMHMGSGKENLRKQQGDLYIKEWLHSLRFVNEDGKKFFNYHFIYDLGFLEELTAYGSGNFDRVSAFRIAMYHQRELMYKEIQAQAPEKENLNNFFNREFFSNNI